jgi:hypothetical protein
VRVDRKRTDSTELHFAGPRQLTFAFGCWQLVLGKRGRIASFDELEGGAFLEYGAKAAAEPPARSTSGGDLLRDATVGSDEELAEIQFEPAGEA